MENITTTSDDRKNRFSLFVLFLVCGLAVFLISITFAPLLSNTATIILRLCLVAFFGVITFLLYQNEKLQRYWQVFFAFFIAAISLFISWICSGWFLNLCNLETNTPNGIAFAKFFESLLIVIPIIILTKISGADLGSIFLKKGRLVLGLII